MKSQQYVLYASSFFYGKAVGLLADIQSGWLKLLWFGLPDFFSIRILTAPLYPNILFTLPGTFEEVDRGFRFEDALFV